MATSTLLLNENGEYLWFALLALGFQPDNERQSYASQTKHAAKHIDLGPSMFEIPNKTAFHIVIHFLLDKLNPTRFREAYRNCWPVFSQKEDTEFRKVTCAWLQEVMDARNDGSKVAMSVLLTPGGHKFVQLILNLAKHVMLQDMQTFKTDESWVPETAAMSTSSLDMERKRFHLVRKRFLRAVVDQDRLLSEYHTENELMVKSMRELKAQCDKFDELLKNQSSGSVPGEASLAEKIEKVRSLWSTIDEMLAVIKENKKTMESVLEGEADQYQLDGTGRVLKVPNILLERIQQLPHQLKSAKTHKDGELNLLCVMELMNHALQLLKEERCRMSHTPKPQISPEPLEKVCHQLDCMVHDLKVLRNKLSEEEAKYSGAIREQEAEWDLKWVELLKGGPLGTFLVEDPDEDFLSPEPLNSVEDDDDDDGGDDYDEDCDSDDLSDYVKQLSEESTAGDTQEDSVLGLSTLQRSTQSPASSFERLEEAPVTPQAPGSNTSLHWLSSSPPPEPAKIQSVQSSQVAVEKNMHVHNKESHKKTNRELLDMEHENLADQFADALTAATSPKGSGNRWKLEDLLDNLQRDPFSARKQLPRTPESLIMDVKRSWQKALKEDEAAKLRTASLNDDVKQKPSLLDEQRGVFGPDPSSNLDSSSIIFPVNSNGSQQKVLQSTLLWDTFNVGGVDSRAVLFSLEHETLPELSRLDSFNLLDDATSGEEEEEEGPLSPSLKTVTKVSPRDCSAPQRMRTPECLLSDFKLARVGRDSLTEPKTETATDKIFSLDLDQLKTPSPLKKQENRLPELLTFSPMDDI